MKMKWAGATVAAFVMTFALQAQAQETLQYTGNAFTTTGTPDFGTSLDATVILDTALPANFTGDISGDIVSASITSVGGTFGTVPDDNSIFVGIGLTDGQVTS